LTEETSFSDWVAARGPALQRFSYLVTGSAADAPDLVQEALARAYPRWEQIAETGHAEAYVRRSIVNASVSGWRRTRRLVAVEDVEALAREHLPDPADALDDADHAWALCLSLPPAQRAAVVLRFYEDLSYAQIAVVLSCPEATARSHVHRALARLRERLTEGAARD
jgi:RNA polymerase sigma-70 factor (sigma-E family)